MRRGNCIQEITKSNNRWYTYSTDLDRSAAVAPLLETLFEVLGSGGTLEVLPVPAGYSCWVV